MSPCWKCFSSHPLSSNPAFATEHFLLLESLRETRHSRTCRNWMTDYSLLSFVIKKGKERRKGRFKECVKSKMWVGREQDRLCVWVCVRACGQRDYSGFVACMKTLSRRWTESVTQHNSSTIQLRAKCRREPSNHLLFTPLWCWCCRCLRAAIERRRRQWATEIWQ
jgi:hypothetical protein